MEYNYRYPPDGTHRTTPPPPKKNNDSWLSWALIALLLFGGAWPIALPWLFIKLFAPDKKNTAGAPSLGTERTVRRTSDRVQRESSSPAAQKVRSTVGSFTESPKSSKAPRALFIAGSIVAGLGLLLLTDSYGVLEFLSYLAWVASGAGMIAGGVGIRNAEKRYTRYRAAIGANPAIHIATLAKKMGRKEKQVKRDLQKMLEKGYFGAGAYINEELGYLFASSEADEELQKARDAAMAKEKAASEAEAAEQEVNYYTSIISQIRDVNDRIAQPEMTRKIYRLEDITRKIFLTVEESPEKRSKISRFLSYYLPTTLKLLESYAKLEKTGLDGENIASSKKTIEDSMDSIVNGFERQLDELYKSDVLDIETELGAMTRMMDRENTSAAKDFGLGAKAEEDDGLPALTLEPNARAKSAGGEVSLGGSAAQIK
ncbi:MAG: 5-bromo-4-chloroindolyl phosphate hydrolysis family protein [Oscillospiraceae bacterium]|nr:5-bromo-4-chloroindolyl phosphate hydrolysis family protein [Oscillospiraceae bacterium]